MSEERMPVTMTDEAKEFLYSSGPESAKFPQALSEAFQLESLSVVIDMEIIPKDAIFKTFSHETDQRLIVTSVKPSEDIVLPVVMPPFTIYTNADDLKQMRVGNIYGFNALKTAAEYVRLYRQHYKDALL